MKTVHIQLPDEWHKELKLQAVMLNCTLKTFVINALIGELKKRKEIRNEKP